MKYFVEEVPQSCWFCDCCHTKDYDSRYKIDGDKFCGIENMEVNDYYETQRKPDWCPLREISDEKNEVIETFARKIKDKAYWLETYTNAFGHTANNLIELVNEVVNQIKEEDK